MGLYYGCNAAADKLFQERHKLTTVSGDTSVMHFRGPVLGKCYLSISTMYNDCTAATLYLEGLKPEFVKPVFNIIQEYLAINARVSAMFTRMVRHADIPKWLEALKDFEIYGLHVQKGNRHPERNDYLITGILKVPNPVVKEYKTWDKAYPDTHDLHDATHFNEVNKSFNLQTV